MCLNAAMTPGEIIDALGGTNAVAELCEVSPSAVSQWRQDGIPKARLMFLHAVRPDIFGPAPGAQSEIRESNSELRDPRSDEKREACA